MQETKPRAGLTGFGVKECLNRLHLLAYNLALTILSATPEKSLLPLVRLAYT
jgi:hypothetical protein